MSRSPSTFRPDFRRTPRISLFEMLQKTVAPSNSTISVLKRLSFCNVYTYNVLYISEVIPLTDDIKQIPVLPEGLREAAICGTLIPFIGAGASRVAGCPNWSEFADAALRFFVDLGKLQSSRPPWL